MPEFPTTRRYFAALIIVLLAFLVLALVSCKTAKPVTTETADTLHTSRTDTVRVARYLHDTLKIRDSIYIKEIHRGDTVYITQFRDRIRYKVALSHDTVYKAVTDTLQAVRVETKTVTKDVSAELTAWQKFRLRWFGVGVAVALAALVWIFRKPLLTLVKKIASSWL